MFVKKILSSKTWNYLTGETVDVTLYLSSVLTSLVQLRLSLIFRLFHGHIIASNVTAWLKGLGEELHLVPSLYRMIVPDKFSIRHRHIGLHVDPGGFPIYQLFCFSFIL